MTCVLGSHLAQLHIALAIPHFLHPVSPSLVLRTRYLLCSNCLALKCCAAFEHSFCFASATLHVLSTHGYCSREGTPPCLQACSAASMIIMSCGADFRHATILSDSRSTLSSCCVSGIKFCCSSGAKGHLVCFQLSVILHLRSRYTACVDSSDVKLRQVYRLCTQICSCLFTPLDAAPQLVHTVQHSCATSSLFCSCKVVFAHVPPLENGHYSSRQNHSRCTRSLIKGKQRQLPGPGLLSCKLRVACISRGVCTPVHRAVRC